MPNPTNLVLAAGHPVAISVFVTANGVQPDGTNPGTPDTTTPLSFEAVSGVPAGVQPSVDPANNRRVILTPGVLQPGGQPVTWGFRIKAAGLTAEVFASGQTNPPADVSGVFWDGAAPSPA